MLGKGAAVGSHRRWGRPPEPRPPLAEADRAGPLGRAPPPPSCTGLVGAPPVGRGGGKAGVTPHGANGGGALGSGTAANRRPAAAKGHRTTPAEEGRGASSPPSPPSPGSAPPPPPSRVCGGEHRGRGPLDLWSLGGSRRACAGRGFGPPLGEGKEAPTWFPYLAALPMPPILSVPPSPPSPALAGQQAAGTVGAQRRPARRPPLLLPPSPFFRPTVALPQ